MAVDDITLSTIIQHEGFRAKPYWDRNAYRIGFGSDTWTDAEGKVHKVTKNTGAITREDAYRDLTRRVPDFQQNGIIRYVGQQAWNQLSPETKAAVTSLAYNYGSLQNLPSLRKAIVSAQPDQIAAAIKARGSDNNGLNRSRRTKEAAMVTPLAPVVPGRPNRDGLTAINDAISAPSVPSVNASAYATVTGATALPPGTPLPPANRNAIPGLPAGTARPLPPGRAMDVPPGTAAPVQPRTALPTVPSLPALEPMVPTIRAREPWSPFHEAAILREAAPRPRTPPSSTFDLAMMLPGYAETYVPTNQRPRELTTRTVRTVPVDPTTGSVTGTDLASALESYADKKRRDLRLREPRLGTSFELQGREALAIPITRQMTRPSLPPPPSQTLQPLPTTTTLRPLPTPGLTVATDPTEPRVMDGRGLDRRVAEQRAEQARLRPRGVPPKPPTQVAALPQGYNPSLPFGYVPVPDRLTPGAPLVPSPGLTAAPARLGFQVGTQPFGPPLPPTNVANAPVPMPRPIVRRPLPPGSDGPNGYIPAADPLTRQLLDAANSPGSAFIGDLNSGRRPLLAGLMRLFVPREGRVSTARSVRPPGRRLDEWSADNPPPASLSAADSGAFRPIYIGH